MNFLIAIVSFLMGWPLAGVICNLDQESRWFDIFCGHNIYILWILLGVIILIIFKLLSLKRRK
jgi:hypothetical protein